MNDYIAISDAVAASPPAKPVDPAPAREKTGKATSRGAKRPRNPHSATRSLTRDGERLFAYLAKSDAFVFIDPTDEDFVILGSSRTSVSLSAGRISRQAAEGLVSHDLALWQSAAGRLSLTLSAAGRSRLRRERAVEGNDGYFDQHRETTTVQVGTGAGTKHVRVDLDESPLDWLRRRRGRDGARLIDAADYAAGERLRADLMQAGLLPRVTARWDSMPGGGPASPSGATDRMVAARQRVRNAFDAIGGDFSDLLMDLCGFLKGLELIERERHWPPRSAKVVIRIALSRLADHYGLETAARGPGVSRGIRSWQAVVIEGGVR